MSARRFAALLAAIGLALLVLAPVGHGRGLRLGFMDSTQFQSSDPAVRSLWLGRAAGLGGNFVSLPTSWNSLASGPRNASTDPTNPADPLYAGFGPLDDAVRSVVAAGLTPMIQLRDAPTWAEGPNRPGLEVAPVFTWMPDPGKFGQLARAIARRYSGDFRNLPAVRYWIPWGEPNRPDGLTPQWRKGRPFAPLHYRRLLNAFYAGIHGVSAANRVFAGALAPYGLPWGYSSSMQPALFWRKLLCMSPRLRRTRCPNPAHFDIAAHNPINFLRPTRRARNRDDISTPDMGKLTRIVRAARRLNTLRPREAKPLWATEIFWESRPPDLQEGFPLDTHARWLAQGLYLLWKQGVSVVIWDQIVDQPVIPGSYTIQSGLFFQNGEPKPARDAYRFPFVAERLGPRTVRVWGKAPAPGPVAVQRLVGGVWRTIRGLHAPGDRIFTATIPLRGSGELRAAVSGQASLGWRQSG